MNYIRLSTLDKKLYHVHVNLYATQPDSHVLEVRDWLFNHPDAEAMDALRVATAGEIRRRKISY